MTRAEIPSSYPDRPGKWRGWIFVANFFAALLYATAAERWLRAVDRAHSMIPYNDSWATPAIGVNTALEQGPGLHTLATLFSASFHNDSIKFFPVLLEYLFNLPNGYWNPVVSIWLAALAWVAVVGLAIGLCCHQLSHPLARLTIVALGCLIGFSPSFRFLVPFGIHRVIPLACCLGIAALLSRTLLGWRLLAGSLVLALVASFSFANGFLAFAVLWVALALRWADPAWGSQIHRRSMVLVAGLFTAMGASLYGFLLNPYHQQVYAERHRDDYQPAKILDAFSTWVSSSLERINDNAQEIFSYLGPDKWAIQALGFTLGLLAAAGFLISWRCYRTRRSGANVFLSSLLGGLFVPITLLLARHRSVGLNDERYLCEITLLSLLIATALLSEVGAQLGSGRRVGVTLIAAILVFGAFSTLPLTYTSGYFKAMRRNVPTKLQLVEHCIKTSDQVNSDLWDLCGMKEIAPDDDASRETFNLLMSRGYWSELRDN